MSRGSIEDRTSTRLSPADGTNDGYQLVGRMGVIQLMLTVLAFTAPLASVVGVIPLVIVFGGVGAPLAFVAMTVILLLFSVGYSTMSRCLPNPGAFYAYISAGLGKVVGLGASFIAILGYAMIGLAVTIFFGIVANDLVVTTFNGPSLSWWLYSLGLVLGVGTFGYFRIDLSAKVLSAVMILEVAIVVVFDVFVAADGGPEGRSLSPFAWGSFNHESIGVAVLFALVPALGFEATAIFREETKNPRRTVPRATYAAVSFIGLFYIFATWLLITAFGTTKAVDAAGADPTGMFANAMGRSVGVWAQDIVSVLVVTSAFASVLSCQNILARYGYSLGVDGVLPAVLGRVHRHHGSPFISSVTISVVFALGVLVFISSDPLKVYAWLAGAGTFPILVLMFLTSAAVLAFFRRSRAEADEFSIWHTLIAPSLALLGLGAVLYFSLRNFTVVTGGTPGTAAMLQAIIWVTFVAGMAAALIYRRRRPEVYGRIGRQSFR